MNYLDRNEFNFEPSQKVVEAIKSFDPKTLCFYTRIYDQGKKSVISVRLSEIYGVPEEQVLLTYGGEDMLKNAIHYFLMLDDNKRILIPEFSWWYYNRVASECGGTFEMYPLHEQDDTFAYDVDEVIEYTNRVHPRMLLLASPNNPTGNGLTPEEIGRIMEHIPSDTMVLIDEAYASFITTDTDYIAPLVNKYNNLIISRTLSKFYGLPGLRVGFGFIGKGHDQFLSYVNKYLGYNRFSEAVALAALDSDEHYRHVADDMEWGRQLYKKELGHLPGFKVYKSVANFILIKYPLEIKDALMEALKIQDYKIKFMSDKGLESCLRITLGRKEQTQTVDYAHNNNIYSLWMAGQIVRGKEFLLMDSDILCDPAAVLRIASEQEAALAVNRHELGEEEMKVVVDSQMRITEISKTCRPEDAMGESVGIEKMTVAYSEALFRELDQMILQEGLIDIFYERAFERLIPQGHTFRVIDTTDYFSYELDTPEDFQRAQELMPAELL